LDSDGTGTGIYFPFADQLFFSLNGLAKSRLVGDTFELGSLGGLVWHSTTAPGAGNTDLYLYRDGASTLQLGKDTPTTTNVVFKGPDGSVANTNGGNLTVAGGIGTGTNSGGWLHLATAGPGPVQGSTQNVLTNRVSISPSGDVTFSNNVTVFGPVLSTSSSTGNPAATEFVVGGWVRGLFDGAGVAYYATTNIAVGFTNYNNAQDGGSNYSFSTTIPDYNFVRTYTAPTNGQYFGSVTTTNKLLQLNSGVTINGYMSSAGGSGTAGPLVKGEIYYSYDGTNWYGDWDGPAQAATEAQTNLYSWVVSNPSYTTTNATGFYVQRRFKIVTQTTPIAADVTFHGGTNFQSHISLSGASVGTGNAYLAADQNFSGSNSFSPVGIAAANITSGTLTDARLSLGVTRQNGSRYITNVTGITFTSGGFEDSLFYYNLGSGAMQFGDTFTVSAVAGDITGIGSNLTALNASALVHGTVPKERLPASAVQINATGGITNVNSMNVNTNLWDTGGTGTNVIGVGKYWWVKALNKDIRITGYTNTDNTYAKSFVLIITNASATNIVFSILNDSNTYTNTVVSNGYNFVLSGMTWGNMFTNYTFKHLP
jgi:hypothetical protein